MNLFPNATCRARGVGVSVRRMKEPCRINRVEKIEPLTATAILNPPVFEVASATRTWVLQGGQDLELAIDQAIRKWFSLGREVRFRHSACACIARGAELRERGFLLLIPPV